MKIKTSLGDTAEFVSKFRVSVLSPDDLIPDNCSLLFQEQLGLIVAPSVAEADLDYLRADAVKLPRLETRTRPGVWHEWSRLKGQDEETIALTTRTFDHYHLTIEAALTGLGAAIAPWHLVAGDVESGRLIAPYGFLHSDYRYVVKVERPGRRKTEHFVKWLKEAIAAFPK